MYVHLSLVYVTIANLLFADALKFVFLKERLVPHVGTLCEDLMLLYFSNVIPRLDNR